MSDLIIEDMLARAKVALKNAYAPYSQFPVAACIQTEDGELYAGANCENAAYSLCQCAETNAIGNMIQAGGRRIQQMVVVSCNTQYCAPCGGCRQRINEFASPDTPIYLFNSRDEQVCYTLAELLPHAFNADNME